MNLLLLYQPIHDAKSGAIVAAEALLRERRSSGEIREAHIISEAAESGPRRDLFALDEWIISTAVRDSEAWPIAVNINLSPREFEEGNLLSRVARAILPARKINLEITETLTIERMDEVVSVLRDLRSIGFGIWLDDFGSGHSTLEELLRFPIDGLKIAATFIKHLPHDERAAAIVRSMLALGRELQVPVAAEGVERDEQLRFLLDHGCDFVQGFLFSRPMPREEISRATAASHAARASSS